ncbi:putative serine/arginine-rich splicing factor SR45 isoform X2 [Iris pallida]|uniref:Serine/arginine-rich splicing factor SR45 isoform X2 n=1 Tax=Iris pallida TaxID=29817 RepID=A0AAX6I3J2_IRIPA|nr:putative serine/arginine-rich splicing factor SR45 isoform X2 [Iris pallida]
MVAHWCCCGTTTIGDVVVEGVRDGRKGVGGWMVAGLGCYWLVEFLVICVQNCFCLWKNRFPLNRRSPIFKS